MVPGGVQVLATQAVASPPDSLLLLDSPAAGLSDGLEGAGAAALFLHVGAHPLPPHALPSYNTLPRRLLLTASSPACTRRVRCNRTCVFEEAHQPDAWLGCAAGLANGVLLRTEVDRVTGQLSDTRTRFLGTRPPSCWRRPCGGCAPCWPSPPAPGSATPLWAATT